MTSDLWACENILRGAGIHHGRGVVVRADYLQHNDINVEHQGREQQVFKVQDTNRRVIFLNNQRWEGNGVHYDLQHHPTLFTTSTGDAATDNEEGDCVSVVRQGNWKPVEIIKVLKDYDDKNGRANHNEFVRYVQKEYKQPKFQTSTLRKWLAKRDEIEASASVDDSDRRRIAVPRESAGQYPDMEYRLAASIRNMRQLGIVVESWMVDEEARRILHELYPNKFKSNDDNGDNNNTNEVFKCSNTWRRNFYKRHNFTLRKIGKKMDKKGTSAERMKKVYDFHLMMRALQLSELNDPVYGVTGSDNVM